MGLHEIPAEIKVGKSVYEGMYGNARGHFIKDYADDYFLTAIAHMFQLGFIPSFDEIIDCPQHILDQLRHVVAEDDEEHYYIISPRDRDYSPKDGNYKVMGEEYKTITMIAIDFFKDYAEKYMIPMNQTEKVLAHAAKRFPPEFTEGTAFQQPRLKLLNGREDYKRAYKWYSFYSQAVGEEHGLTIYWKMKVDVLKELGLQKMMQRERDRWRLT